MRRRARERGQVIPLIALALTVLMGSAGIAVDTAYLEYRQQAQQNATDAAAMGGAEALLHSGCPNSSAAQTAAYANAANNGFSNGGNVAVTPSNPPPSGPFAANSCAVSVTIATRHAPDFFAKLFGYPSGMDISTQGTAIVAQSNSSCIYLLSMTQNSDFSNSHIDAPQCGITINASANMSTATIDAASIGYAGIAPNVSGATFPEAAPAATLPVADPCPEITGCAYLANNPPSTSGCAAGGTYNNATLSAGCYSKLTLSGTDTLNPGLYVINGQFHMNNAAVSGTGVTFYLTANVSDTNFSSANLTLSPPTSGNTKGVLMYRVPAQNSALDLSTCTCNLSGLLYFPTTQVNYSNTGDNYTVLVFGDANFSTSHGLDLGTPPAGAAIVGEATLAQ